MAHDSEYRAYEYIRQVLKDIGWDTGNPGGRNGGDVYTQHEFYNHDSLLTKALVQKTPENVVVIPWDNGSRYWLIEAKREHSDLGKAVDEAKSYADIVNSVSPNTARFATGIAGTPDQSFYVSTYYWNDAEWNEVSINNHETTGFLSPQQCREMLDSNTNKLTELGLDHNRFLRKTHAINKTLHDNEIPVGDRAGFIAALLLALAQDGQLRIHKEPRLIINEINGLITEILTDKGKSAFAQAIGLRVPATEKNHKKFRTAIVDTLQHLREMNIRSAINSGTDILGQFYETFLKYANGAKEMGVVLTPRHITKFAVDVVGIGPNDRVFDPTAGTGGFLVAAMEKIREKNPRQYDKFRCDGLFGVEQRDDVYGLAVVNMIFRGDGQSRMIDGNCLDHQFWLRDQEVFYTLLNERNPDGAKRPFSRVLMNPPFKLKVSESEFVNYAINQMEEKGLLFAVLPSVVISGKKFECWRHEILKRHTLKACVKFDKSLFYPVAAQTYGIILEVHTPHITNDDVYWGVMFDDNHRTRRSKVLSRHDTKDNVNKITEQTKRFLFGQSVTTSIPREQHVAPVDLENKCEFAPEHYILSGPYDISKSKVIDRSLKSQFISVRSNSNLQGKIELSQPMRFFELERLIMDKCNAPLKNLKDYPDGCIPVVSATSKNNGIAGWYDVPDNLLLENCITIAKVHNTKPCEAFWHPYRFSAINTVLIFKPKHSLLEYDDSIWYLCEAITAGNAWRHNYERPVVLEKIEVELPVDTNDEPDIAAMANAMKQIRSKTP